MVRKKEKKKGNFMRAIFRNSVKIAPISLLMMITAACSSSPAAPAARVATVEAATTTPSSAVKASADAGELVASGPIIVEDQVDVAAQRDGVVARVLAEPGTPVKKGQLLAALDDRQISSDLEAARARTRSTEDDLKNWEAEAKVLDSDYARAEKMWEAQIIPKEQLEHARYKAESDQWDVKRVSELLTNAKQAEHSLELELEKTQITAPFKGIVARRYVRVGQTVARNDRLFWVTAIAPLRIRVTLPEKFLGHIKSGTMIAVTPAEALSPDHYYRAKVIQVSPVVDPSSDTIEILAELSGDTSGLRPGMRANLHVPDVH
jgi:RND family efflux transporter MFP subunit